MLWLQPFLAGWLLGWSVAWPPGPINAEMVRRALSRGFWSASSVGLGASGGDFLWAVAVLYGTAPLRKLAELESLLSVVSFSLLAGLGIHFLLQARREWSRSGGDRTVPDSGQDLADARGGFLLGLGMALTSPWNLAFWLAVMGQFSGQEMATGAGLSLAIGVVLAASLWSLGLSAAVRFWGRGLGPRWAAASQVLTGLVMLAFAARAGARWLS